MLQMSILSSLLLLLLWFSFHACHARSVGVIHNETGKKFHHSVNKENEKLNPPRVSVQPGRKASAPNDTRDAKQESVRFEKGKVSGEPNHEDGTRIDQAKGDRIKVSGTGKRESVASVSWRVPYKKRGSPEPGFNLDYLPPKTHPPVHN